MTTVFIPIQPNEYSQHICSNYFIVATLDQAENELERLKQGNSCTFDLDVHEINPEDYTHMFITEIFVRNLPPGCNLLNCTFDINEDDDEDLGNGIWRIGGIKVVSTDGGVDGFKLNTFYPEGFENY